MPDDDDYYHEQYPDLGLPEGVDRSAGIDGAPWGQQRTLVSGDGPVTIFELELIQRRKLTEPSMRGFALGLGGPVNNSAPDFHVVAQVFFGTGDVRGSFEASITRGTLLAVPASAYRVDAYVEPIPDMTQSAPAFYPPNGEEINVYGMSGVGLRAGTEATRFKMVRLTPGSSVVVPIPRYAARMIALADNLANLALLSVSQSADNRAFILQNNPNGFPPNNIPIVPNATALNVTLDPSAAVESLITICFLSCM